MRKEPFGRPTKYRPEMCDVLIEQGRQGKSIAQMCVALDIARHTFEEWRKKRNDFSAAVDRALMLSQAWWESQGQEGIWGKSFNSSAYKLQVINRFPKDWQDRREIVVDEADPLAARLLAARRRSRKKA